LKFAITPSKPHAARLVFVGFVLMDAVDKIFVVMDDAGKLSEPFTVNELGTVIDPLLMVTTPLELLWLLTEKTPDPFEANILKLFEFDPPLKYRLPLTPSIIIPPVEFDALALKRPNAVEVAVILIFRGADIDPLLTLTVPLELPWL